MENDKKNTPEEVISSLNKWGKTEKSQDDPNQTEEEKLKNSLQDWGNKKK